MTAPRSLYGLARELGRPVVRGQIRLAHADAALIVETLQQERAGQLQGRHAADEVSYKRWVLRQEVERQSFDRTRTIVAIERQIKPMIAARRPHNSVLAEAHGVNGADGFPLDEDEVTNVVRTAIFWALPPAPWGRRHAG